MNGRTHLIWSFAIGLLIARLLHVSFGVEFCLLLFLTIIGGLAPDLDHPQSMLGHKVKVLNYGAKHRGFLHSIWAVILFGLLLYKFFLAWRVEILCFVCGYVGHLLLDTITPAGVSWVYPFGKIRGPITSDGIGGIIVAALGIVANLFFIWMLF